MKRRRFKTAGFNQRLVMDVGLAGLGVRILPMIVNKFFPLDPTLYTVAGAGATYLIGSMMKRPDMANSAIALGVVEFLAPVVENMVGGIGSAPQLAPLIQPSGKVMPAGIVRNVSSYKIPPLDYYLI